MFMEALKKFVITLVTVLIFMSAVEMIAPSKMKKYIKFVLGLILITIILNPILQIVEGGEKTLQMSLIIMNKHFQKIEIQLILTV